MVLAPRVAIATHHAQVTTAPQALAWIQQPQNGLKTTLHQSASHQQGHVKHNQ